MIKAVSAVTGADIAQTQGVNINAWPISPDQKTPDHLPMVLEHVACAGEIVAAHDGEPDHAAYRGLPSLGYALTQGRRAAEGWPALAGNHVMIRCDGGAIKSV